MRSLVGWKDRVVQYPKRYTQSSSGGYVTLTRAPGTVTEEGTAQNATNFGAMDHGILDNEIAIRILIQNQLQLSRRVAALES